MIASSDESMMAASNRSCATGVESIERNSCANAVPRRKVLQGQRQRLRCGTFDVQYAILSAFPARSKAGYPITFVLKRGSQNPFEETFRITQASRGQRACFSALAEPQ